VFHASIKYGSWLICFLLGLAAGTTLQVPMWSPCWREDAGTAWSTPETRSSTSCSRMRALEAAVEFGLLSEGSNPMETCWWLLYSSMSKSLFYSYFCSLYYHFKDWVHFCPDVVRFKSWYPVAVVLQLYSTIGSVSKQNVVYRLVRFVNKMCTISASLVEDLYLVPIYLHIHHRIKRFCFRP
jgi:hypothetical protein